MTKTKIKKIYFVLFLFWLLMPLMVFAVDLNNTVPQTFELNVPIGGLSSFEISATNNNLLGDYIKAWYGFLLGTIGVLAAVMVMWGGVKYLASRGDKGVIDSAKTIIISALTGLVLAFGTYTILNLISPNLLTIKMPSLQTIQGGENVKLGSYGRELSGEGAAIQPNTTTPQNTQSNAKNIPCTDTAGRVDYSRAYTASYEGYRDTPYWDVNGYSIGYGHHYSSSESVPQSITQTQALELFNADYNAAAAAAQSTFSANWASMGQARQAVLTDLAYNMGTGIFAKFPVTTAAINNGDFAAAANALLNSDYAEQLPQRAANNAEILRNNNDNLYASQALAACQ